jgi:putative hydrolase of the HAD superfamily
VALGRVVSLDALGTLVELDDPVRRLAEELGRRGVAVSEAQAGAALRAEIAYYRAHHDTAVDAASLAVLRARCTAVLCAALQQAGVDGEALQALAPGALGEALLAALRFAVFADVPDALRELRAAGHRLVVVSNWDVSLHDMLRATGLDELIDAAISSAEARARKPAPEIFARAVALAGGAGDGPPAVHAGDSVELDVAGALGAGLDAVLVVRAGVAAAVPDGVPVIDSLTGLAALVS